MQDEGILGTCTQEKKLGSDHVKEDLVLNEPDQSIDSLKTVPDEQPNMKNYVDKLIQEKNERIALLERMLEKRNRRNSKLQSVLVTLCEAL